MIKQKKVIPVLHSHARGYLLALLACSVLSSILTICSPNEYAAEMSLVDESKETDIILGLTHAVGWYKQNMADEDPMYEMPVYATLLESPEFIDSISKVRLPSYGKMYGEYILNDRKQPFWSNFFHWFERMFDDEFDEHYYVIDRIISSIHSRFYWNKRSITIQVIDSDPLVAAQVADSLRVHLHARLVAKKQAKALADLRDADKELDHTAKAYRKAIKEYSAFSDAHRDIMENTQENIKRRNMSFEVSRLFEEYSDAIIKHERAKAFVHKSSYAFTILDAVTVPVKPVRPSWMIYMVAISFWVLIIQTWYYLYKQ